MELRQTGEDAFQLDLHPDEAALITALCEGLKLRLLTDPHDGDLARLSPAASDDDEVAREYREVVGDQLVAARVEALDTMVRTAEHGALGRDDLERWMMGINALRLTLGTALGVEEDHDLGVGPDEPDQAEHQLYDDLGAVLALFLHVLTRS